MPSRPLRFLNALTPLPRVVRESGIAYGPEPRHRLDVYRPHRRSRAAPTVLFFYGGSWQWGDRNDYAFVGRALAGEGFVAVVPDYRTFPPHAFPSFLEDAALALRWARGNVERWAGDPSRLYLMGHSAGAHIAVMLAADDRWLEAVGETRRSVRGAIGLAGPYDFLPLRDPKLQALFGPEAGLAATQPINHVNGDEPAMLLLHGDADTTVGVRNSRRLAARIRECGGSVEEIVYRGVGHAGILVALIPAFRFWAPVLRDAARFIREP